MIPDIDGPLLRSDLPFSIVRRLKFKEKYLNKRGRTIWSVTTPQDERLVMARLTAKGDAAVTCTIGFFDSSSGQWSPAQ